MERATHAMLLAAGVADQMGRYAGEIEAILIDAEHGYVPDAPRGWVRFGQHDGTYITTDNSLDEADHDQAAI